MWCVSARGGVAVLLQVIAVVVVVLLPLCADAMWLGAPYFRAFELGEWADPPLVQALAREQAAWTAMSSTKVALAHVERYAGMGNSTPTTGAVNHTADEASGVKNESAARMTPEERVRAELVRKARIAHSDAVSEHAHRALAAAEEQLRANERAPLTTQIVDSPIQWERVAEVEGSAGLAASAITSSLVVTNDRAKNETSDEDDDDDVLNTSHRRPAGLRNFDEAVYRSRIRDGVMRSRGICLEHMLERVADRTERIAVESVKAANGSIAATLVVSAVVVSHFQSQLVGKLASPYALRDAWNIFFPSRRIPAPSIHEQKFAAQWINAHSARTCGANSDEERYREQRARHNESLHLVCGAERSAILVGLLHVKQSVGGLGGFSPEVHEAVMDLAGRLGTLTGSTAYLRKAAKQAFEHFELATGSRKLGMSIDLVSLGRTASLVSNFDRESRNQFNAYDPGAFRADETQTGGLYGYDSTRFARQQDNMASVIKATAEALREHSTDVTEVATADAFLAAFDNFVRDAQHDTRGIINRVELRPFNELDVLRALARDHFGTDDPYNVDVEQWL